ncbi:MAG: hypothetical protein OXE98_00370 [Hyphomicrobiales bacterium]|nr:hypothetical protein [Hyphomicrobiales bacterium]
MNTLRLATITLSLTLLAAGCGGGGGGGGASGGGGGGGVTPPPRDQALPDWLIPDTEQARMDVGGTILEAMTEDQIEEAIGLRVDTANTLEFIGTDSEGVISCMDRSCTETIPTSSGDAVRVVFDLDKFNDTPVFDGNELMGFNQEYRAVMGHREVTVVEARSAGRVQVSNRNISFQFQSYVGWLENSLFGVESRISIAELGTGIRFTSYSFGNSVETNPTSDATWNGVMIGANQLTDNILHGDATITFSFQETNVDIDFMSIRDLDAGVDFSTTSMSWEDIEVIDGSFATDPNVNTSTGTIKGAFYGNSHEEVGGIFERNYIIGSFGGVR